MQGTFPIHLSIRLILSSSLFQAWKRYVIQTFGNTEAAEKAIDDPGKSTPDLIAG
jgi:hypothetical protein